MAMVLTGQKPTRRARSRALIEYGFRELQVRRIVALTARGNTDSINVMKRVGMKVGVNPDPQVVYPGAVGIIENDWTAA